MQCVCLEGHQLQVQKRSLSKRAIAFFSLSEQPLECEQEQQPAELYSQTQHRAETDRVCCVVPVGPATGSTSCRLTCATISIGTEAPRGKSRTTSTPSWAG